MTVPQQRSQQQPWPSSVAQQQRTPAAPQAQHRLVPAAAAAPPKTGSAMAVLRVTTYVLTSIASLLFILLVIYGAVKVNQLQDAFSSSPFGGGYTSSSYEVSPNE